jgi:hypothetical protein
LYRLFEGERSPTEITVHLFRLGEDRKTREPELKLHPRSKGTHQSLVNNNLSASARKTFLLHLFPHQPHLQQNAKVVPRLRSGLRLLLAEILRQGPLQARIPTKLPVGRRVKQQARQIPLISRVLRNLVTVHVTNFCLAFKDAPQVQKKINRLHHHLLPLISASISKAKGDVLNLICQTLLHRPIHLLAHTQTSPISNFLFRPSEALKKRLQKKVTLKSLLYHLHLRAKPDRLREDLLLLLLRFVASSNQNQAPRALVTIVQNQQLEQPRTLFHDLSVQIFHASL